MPLRNAEYGLRIPLRIALWALGLRLVSAVLALFVNLTFPLHQREQFTVFGSTSPFWDTFARYDAGYFEGIAWGGYAPLAGGRSNIAFFPVYPLLMRAVGRLFGRQHAIFYISGIGISWLCFILAMVALYYLARLDLPRHRAERAVLLTMIFPFSFFYGIAYSESTFLLFVVLAVLRLPDAALGAGRALRRDRDGHAGARRPDAAGARLARVAERPARPGAIASARSPASRSRPAVSAPIASISIS